jgi:hypothetical protein
VTSGENGEKSKSFATLTSARLSAGRVTPIGIELMEVWGAIQRGGGWKGGVRAKHKASYHDSYRLSIVFWITELAFEWEWRKLKDLKGLRGG